MGDMKRDNPWSINWASSFYLFLFSFCLLVCYRSCYSRTYSDLVGTWADSVSSWIIYGFSSYSRQLTYRSSTLMEKNAVYESYVNAHQLQNQQVVALCLMFIFVAINHLA